MMTASRDADLLARSRRCWGALEPIHAIGYFAPEPAQAYVDLGLHKSLAYFAARSAAMGPVPPEVTTATFYVFAPWLAKKTLPAAWEIASPAQIQHARRDGVQAALHRVLGTPDVTEAVELAKEATAGLTAPGRPLYAAHSQLDWPEDPLLALWHAATLIREHRGDGHIAVLLCADLDPVEALVIGGLFADNTQFLKSTRGWKPEEWSAAEDRLRDRHLLTDEGDLSEQGRGFRQQIEDDTDALAVDAFAHLGMERTQRLDDLVAPLRKTMLGASELPGWMTGRGQ